MSDSEDDYSPLSSSLLESVKLWTDYPQQDFMKLRLETKTT
jgi:hypothetical protein